MNEALARDVNISTPSYSIPGSRLLLLGAWLRFYELASLQSKCYATLRNKGQLNTVTAKKPHRL
jgi:hypothetical protein